MRASLILPTYNERESLPRLIAALRPRAPRLGLGIVFVDEASPGGTARVVEGLETEGWIPIRLIRRPGKLGLASAVLAGAAVASAPIIAVMDSDGSHPPEVLPALMA